jgi:hypothetical protein
MADYYPSWKLYASDGVSLVYTFDYVLDWGDGVLVDPQTFTEHTSLRGQGSIISEGSTAPWDLTLEFYLTATNYVALIAKMKALNTTIAFNTKYLLKMGLTTGSATTENLYVKRLSPIRWPISGNKKVVNGQRGFITFRVNSWK